jgi:peptidoglycan/xylan/chitin deacetylase (PgdA/CDA1 family)/tellurite resistance-related uncharacterized protein
MTTKAPIYIVFCLFLICLLITPVLAAESTSSHAGIALTFDDDSVDAWYAIRPILLSYDAHATFFVSGFAYLNQEEIDKLLTLQSDGNEIAFHGYNHEDAVEYLQDHSLNDYMNNEIIRGINLMKSNGFNPVDFAFPYGSDDPGATEAMKPYFLHMRDTYYDWDDTIYYEYGSNSSYIAGIGIDDNTYGNTMTDIYNGILKAKQDDRILIFYCHKPVATNPGEYETSYDRLEKILQYVSDHEMKTYSIKELDPTWAVPVAAFSAIPISGTAPLVVTLTDTSTNTPTSWSWSFRNVTGNNTEAWFSTLPDPTHTFGVGNYSLVLNASNRAGYNLSNQVTFINVTSPASITVASPNGGEMFQRGNTHTVTWNYAGNPGSYVKITRLQGKVEVGTISVSTSIGSNGKGSYTWSILPFGTTGTNCRVKIESISQPTINDTSDSDFILSPSQTPSSIIVTSPNGGEIWKRGTTQRVNWDYTGTPGSYVKITRLQGGVEVGLISTTASAGINGKGSYAWVISPTGSTGTNCRVKIQSISQPAINDTSNNDFTLAPAGAALPTFTVSSPNGGETWKRGTTQRVNWDYTGNPGSYVKITRLQGGVEIGTISASTSTGTGGHGSFVWNIGATGTTGTNCRVKIQSISQPTVSDVSNNYFTLTL